MRTFADEEEALAFLGTIPWGIAAGVTHDPLTAVKYAQTGITAVGFGSIIEESGWGGNPGEVYHFDEHSGISINNIGLADPGIDKQLLFLQKIRKAIEIRGAKLWVSFSARLQTDPRSYLNAASRLAISAASHVNEANTACGNILLPSGKRKKPICLDLPLFKETVSVWKEGSVGVETAIKVGPTTDADLLAEWVDTCLENEIDYLEFANTIPNGNLLTDDFKPAVTGSRGGIGGAALEPFVSAMLRDAVPLVKGNSLKLIATGGILSGITAYKYLLLGAHGFRFNTICTRPGGGPQSIAELITGTDAQHGLLYYLVKHGLPSGQYA
jgi:dihydroorotate dehydrogenase